MLFSGVSNGSAFLFQKSVFTFENEILVNSYRLAKVVTFNNSTFRLGGLFSAFNTRLQLFDWESLGSFHIKFQKPKKTKRKRKRVTSRRIKGCDPTI